ncbi:3-hydroxyisobutyrate dehydrogenase [Pseudomonas indica]|jgi:L-serine 3-dehydrogenase (NAD+)|uniref:3-hydroxyisobutyrate dehydrogenase n=1 Tax=Pseudomonas indica TaxID=137658 RepID=A0A1G9PI73_9PSED|nr:3-hydroxyisobutyrate dehydrogenase [Pseudomonas indica]MBU3055905.1 3-hydroxyisobutyrate dehydrogenase [Pseudomonas indica]SDL97825.1 3-hydroxyisobutyrate dehydrogenase [Pseudomonas indica]
MKQIAFIGLGHMGLPMARNLLKAGFQLSVFDLVQSAVDQLAGEGARAAASATEASENAEVIVSMLPASRHVEGLYLGDDGLLSRIPAGRLVLECSTIAPESAKKVHQAARERGIDLLDAPVSGGTAGAAAGTLTFMVGGDAAALEKAQPVFAAMGKNIFHAGPDGAGQIAKVCNNQLLAVQMIGTAESMAMGVANGLDPKVLAEIMRQSSGGNWVLERYNPWPGVMENAPASKGYGGGFMAELMAKDLGLAQETAQVSASSTPMGALALQLYRLLLKQGKGKQDFSVVQQLFRDER